MRIGWERITKMSDAESAVSEAEKNSEPVETVKDLNRRGYAVGII